MLLLSRISNKITGFLTLQQMAWILLLLGILDAGLTDIGLRTGIVYEANPVAEYLYHLDPLHLSFYFIKIALPLSFVFLASRVKYSSMVLPFFLLATGAYLVITFFHMVWITVFVHLLLS